ncbi:hypothetical protein VUR80DRAFT_7538 [Thermomyces stellatus]
MPPRKRARKAAEAPGPNKKRRPSPDASDHAEDEANAIACPQSITMPSPTDSSDPAVLDEEDAPFEAPQSEAATAEGMNIATDEASEKPQQVRARAGGGGGYNALKSFNGQVYTGMAVGGSHTWNYDAGTWKETKQEPDLWKVDYQTTKRRARAAPKGSGAPVGAEYHWLIVAHQHVKKLDANTYSTHLEGSKYKLAHKSSSSKAWSVPTVKGQREREVEILGDARRRVEGLPPVLASQKVKSKEQEKGQQRVDALFSQARERSTAATKKTGDTAGD